MSCCLELQQTVADRLVLKDGWDLAPVVVPQTARGGLALPAGRLMMAKVVSASMLRFRSCQIYKTITCIQTIFLM